MNSIMDLHTHTIASGHGYSTLKENIEVAQAAGLKYLGMSEHGIAMPGGPHEYFFSNYKCIPRQYGELRLFCGIEANIMDTKGTLDLPDYLLPKMDYVIASMHVPCVTPGSRAENTRASIGAMESPYVKILGHPDDGRYPLDYEELVRAAKELQVVPEINNSSPHPQSPRPNARENIKLLLKACMKHQLPVVMGTDSHICYSIGRFDQALGIMEEVGFPEELVLNFKEENIARLVNVSL